MNEIILRKNTSPPARVGDGIPDTLGTWLDTYFAVEVTTADSSRKLHRRDIGRFIDFVRRVEGREDRVVWTARLSRAFGR